MLDELLQQGVRYIEDARFVRDHFVPAAFSQARWNIAVYEAHRGTELLLRGMTCQVGFKPQEGHDISGHISFLHNRLPGAKSAVIPFTIGAYVESGRGYGMILDGASVGSLQLFRLDSGIFTQLGSTARMDLPTTGRINLKLDLRPPEVVVYCNDSRVLSTTDSTYLGPFQQIDRSFVRQPDTAKIRLLKKFGDQLTRNRNLAYYEEKLYTRDDASLAISAMRQSFAIASAFFSFE